MSDIYCYQAGKVYGAIFAGPRNKIGGVCAILVTNNSVVWSAKMFPSSRDALDEAQRRAGCKLSLDGYTTLSHTIIQNRLSIQWAKKAVVKIGKVYTIDAAKTSKEESMSRSHGSGKIAYVGFDLVAKRSAHTIEVIHEIVDKALKLCMSKWKWKASGIEIGFHTDIEAMGLAYAPGTGTKRQVRRVSLSVKLLESYDRKSIHRVVIHEFAHHRREEKWPRTRTSKSDGHDKLFCETLGAVDPLVNPKKQETCQFFSSVKDGSIVANIEKKLGKKAPVWSPTAGNIVMSLVGKRYRIAWVPRSRAARQWKPIVSKVYGATMIEFARRFAPGDWKKVKVVNQKCRFRGKPPRDLLGLLLYFIESGGSTARQLKEYLAAVKGTS